MSTEEECLAWAEGYLRRSSCGGACLVCAVEALTIHGLCRPRPEWTARDPAVQAAFALGGLCGLYELMKEAG